MGQERPGRWGGRWGARCVAKSNRIACFCTCFPIFPIFPLQQQQTNQTEKGKKVENACVCGCPQNVSSHQTGKTGKTGKRSDSCSDTGMLASDKFPALLTGFPVTERESRTNDVPEVYAVAHHGHTNRGVALWLSYRGVPGENKRLPAVQWAGVALRYDRVGTEHLIDVLGEQSERLYAFSGVRYRY